MRPEPVEAPLLLADTASEIRCEAKGQVLVLAPWNYPVFLALGPLVGAIAAGNVVMVKPSEKVPETNRALRALLAEAFPETEVAMVEGEAPVAEALLELPFDHVFFTGSTRVGKMVMAAAAKHLASVTLELGGKSPAIVAPGRAPRPGRRTPSPGAASSTPVRPASRRTTSWSRRDSGRRCSTGCAPRSSGATDPSRGGPPTGTSRGSSTRARSPG